MFLIKQYITLLSFQIVRYQVASRPGENTGANDVQDVSVERADLSEIEERLANLEAYKQVSLQQYYAYLTGLERLVKDNPDERNDPEFQEFTRRIEMWRDRLEEIQKEAQSIDNGLQQGVIQQSIRDIGESARDARLLDRTENFYTQEFIEELGTEVSNVNTNIRKIFFDEILNVEDAGQDIVSFAEHDRIKALREQQTDEGYQYGYDIDDIFTRLEGVDMPGEDGELQDTGEKLELALVVLSEINREISILARDIKIIEGEKTFGEARIDVSHEGYQELLKDAKIKEALENSNGDIPNFQDLRMDHIMLIRENGGDLKKLFLAGVDGTSFTGDSLEVGKQYVLTFSDNEELASSFDISLLDLNVSQVTVDGKVLDFQRAGVKGVGFYDENNNKYPLKDGSLIEVLALQELSNQERIDIENELRDQVQHHAERAVNDAMYRQALLGNPQEFFDGKTLPKGLLGTIMAFIHNIIHKLTGKGEEYKYDEASGTWRSGEAVLTNQAVREGYIDSFSGDMKLGSLSAEFESSSQGPYAYNPNDNGHGPSYGTYQMNTNKGVYREFARLHNIGPGKEGWHAAIAKHGVDTFKQMEHDFIKAKNYDPMMARLRVADKDKFSPAMQNVIWSIAVQHGPGNQRLLDVINNSGVKPGDIESEELLIHALYDMRGQIWPAGIQSRYNKERSRAIAMLNATLLGASSDVYNQNIDTSQFSNFTSVPAQRNNRTNTPLCSKTARLNFEKIGVRGVPRGGSAKASFEAYPSSRVDRTFPEDIPANATVADVFCDASKDYRKYGHRAIALKQPNGWMVYDPHYGFGNGTPADNYVRHMANTGSRQQMWGAVYYS